MEASSDEQAHALVSGRWVAVDRKILRERERKSREKRAARLDKKRTVLGVLESVAAVFPTLQDDDDTVWQNILDPDTMRVRNYLKRSIPLARIQQQLERDRAQLDRLLEEHRLASIAIEGLYGCAATDGWEDSLRRWRSIARKHFIPWTKEECLAEIEVALKELNAFVWSLDTQWVGASYFGWRVGRRINESRDTIQFSFEKIFRGFPMMDFVTSSWRCYTTLEVYSQVVFANHVRCWLEVQQEVTPEIAIVQCHERIPAFSLDTHTLYLVALVKTDSGFVVFVRTIFVPEVQTKISESMDMWASNHMWLSFEPLNEDATDYRAHMGGKLSGHDTNYAAQWLMETLAVLLRAEWYVTKRGLLLKG